MFHYGKRSKENRRYAHPHLIEIMDQVLETDDHSWDCGGRLASAQQVAFENRASTIPGYKPDGSQNEFPHMIQEDGYSYAMDVCPYIGGKRLATSTEDFGPYQMAQFAWFLRRIADVAEIYFEMVYQQTGERWKLRFGIDWDGDNIILTDQKFQDWFHVEAIRIS